MIEKDEINKSIARLKWVCQQLKLESSYGKNSLSNIKPYKSDNKEELLAYFQNLNISASKIKETPNLFSRFNRLFMELRNISGSVKNIINNHILGETELFEIKNFAIVVSDILELAKNYEILPDYLISLDLKPVILILNPDKIIFSPTGTGITQTPHAAYLPSVLFPVYAGVPL